MNRYKNVNIEKDNLYESIIVKSIPEQDNDIYIITPDGISLTYLATKYLNDPTRYVDIIYANENIIDGDSLYLQGGLRIRIPQG